MDKEHYLILKSLLHLLLKFSSAATSGVWDQDEYELIWQIKDALRNEHSKYPIQKEKR
jgi:hypothetical protein